MTAPSAATDELSIPEDPAALEEEETLPEPTAQESAEQHEAYKQSAEDLDSMLRQANPGLDPSAPVSMEHIIQSMYLSAIVAMGAATEPGQKPRIDIIGADRVMRRQYFHFADCRNIQHHGTVDNRWNPGGRAAPDAEVAAPIAFLVFKWLPGATRYVVPVWEAITVQQKQLLLSCQWDSAAHHIEQPVGCRPQRRA